MKFDYTQYFVEPSPAAPERSVLYRPVVPVRYAGPHGAVDFYALLDTGADESYITEELADELGVTPVSETRHGVNTASGAMAVWYGRLTVEVTDGVDRYSFPAVVGVVSGEWDEAILGHVGFLEHFDATFSYADKCVTLTTRMS